MDINLTSESVIHSNEENKKHPLTLKENCSKKGLKENSHFFKKVEKDPWLTSSGEMKPDKEIQLLGQSWSASTWERFLKTSIEVPEPSSDTTVIFPFMDTEAVVQGSNLIKYLQNLDEYEELKKHLQHALKYLSKRERQIIRMRYWDNLTISEIGEKLNLKRNTVASTRKNGIKKLKKYLCSQEFRNRVNHLERLRK